MCTSLHSCAKCLVWKALGQVLGRAWCLQAVRSGDPSQLQQAQLNIAQRRAGIRTPVGATPAGFGTPGASLLRTLGIGLTPPATTPAMTPRLGINAGTVDKGRSTHTTVASVQSAFIMCKCLPLCQASCMKLHIYQQGCCFACVAESLSCKISSFVVSAAEGRVVSDGPKDPTLDKFFAQHNSEDNSDFKELMKLSQERQRRAKPWLYQDHNPPKDHPLLLTNATAQQQPSAILPVPHSLVMASPAAVPQEVPGTDIQVVVYQAGNAAATKDADRAVQRPAEPTDGYGTTGQESQTLLGWPHTNKSALYYDSSQRDVVPFTEAELADMVQGPPKQIKYSATRFPADFDTTQQPSKVHSGVCLIQYLVRCKRSDMYTHICFSSIMPACNSKALVHEGCHTCLASCTDLTSPHQELYDAVTGHSNVFVCHTKPI